MSWIKSIQAAIQRSSVEPKYGQVISGTTLRYYIGILAILLPSALVIGSILFDDCKGVQGSISAYYHTSMRDLFVGILAAVAFSMFAYKGYRPELYSRRYLCRLYAGVIKPLGAWGGDFVLASGSDASAVKAYFKGIGLDTIVSYKDMISA